jgi:hypothetical protein
VRISWCVCVYMYMPIRMVCLGRNTAAQLTSHSTGLELRAGEDYHSQRAHTAKRVAAASRHPRYE